MATHEDENKCLNAAIATSLGEQTNTSPDPKATAPATATGPLGLNLKALAEERMARAASRKRERSISPPPRNSRKAPKLEETTVDMQSGARLKMFSSIVQEDQAARKSPTANAAIAHMKKEPSPDVKVKDEPQDENGPNPESLPSGALKYPNGVVKKTWAFGHERTGNEVKIEEVLEASTLRTAVLSAFQWDTDWLLPKLKTPLHGGKTKCIFVMQAKEDKERDRLKEWASEGASFMRICLPSMNGLIWCMHSKLMLLFHPDKLRIAIPTANLLNFDWGETGQMENSVFMIDLPRLPNGTSTNADDLTFFGKELMFFIEKQGLDQDVRNGVLNFDFAATEDMAFVHTAGGVHWRQQAEHTGLLGLSRAIQTLNLDTQDLEIDFAASSIGQLNEKYLQDFHASASGQDLIAQAAEARAKAGADFFKKGKKATATGPDIKDKLRIYFPTKDTVQASTAGAAGTICLQRKYFEANHFPKSTFRDYKSTRRGLLSHNKILCARSKEVAWVYVGSANMSKSAWGELPADRREKKITCRNWECGVILPVARRKASQKVKKEVNEDAETDSEDEPEPEPQGLVEMEEFKKVIDLPFEVPGDVYNGREPWYFTEEH